MTVLSKPKSDEAHSGSIDARLRIDFLDGIRALAALWVVLSHTWILQFGMLTHAGLLGDLTNWLVYSHFAVDIFIVLSGFCLILPVLRSEKPLIARDFYLRRARRILPPYYAALGLGVLVTLLELHAATGVWRQDIAALLANVFLVQDALIRHDIFNGPLWSVAVEWRIYFLFPLIVLVLLRGGRVAALGLSALVGFGLTALVLDREPGLLMSCVWYVFLFGMGVCAASLLYGRVASRAARLWPIAAVASLAILAGCLRVYPITPREGSTFGAHMPLLDCAVGAFTAACLIGIGRQHYESRVVRFLASKPLVAVGTFSYSLYLIHLPILRMMNLGMGGAHSAMTASAGMREAILLVVGLPIVVGAAYLFYLAVEKPCIAKKSQSKPAPSAAVLLLDRHPQSIPLPAPSD